MMFKFSSLKEESAMLRRTVVLIAASLVIVIGCIATGSTNSFARDAQMTRLNHKGSHHHPINHGRSAHPSSMGKAAATPR